MDMAETLEHLSELNLVDALAKFQAEMPAVAKTKEVRAGQRRYSYAELADVVKAAMPLLAKHGLAFSCQPRFNPEAGAWQLDGSLMHVNGGELRGSLPLVGHTMQEIGSSLTYGRRYLIGCMTGIVTDDDDDGQEAQRAGVREAGQEEQHWRGVLELAANARTMDELHKLYTTREVATAPEPVRKRFTALVQAMKAKETA